MQALVEVVPATWQGAKGRTMEADEGAPPNRGANERNERCPHVRRTLCCRTPSELVLRTGALFESSRVVSTLPRFTGRSRVPRRKRWTPTKISARTQGRAALSRPDAAKLICKSGCEFTLRSLQNLKVKSVPETLSALARGDATKNISQHNVLVQSLHIGSAARCFRC